MATASPIGEAASLFLLLRQFVDPSLAADLETFVAETPEDRLVRINPIALAAEFHLDEEKLIAALLHAAKVGIFDMSWNVLCPDCGSVLDRNTSLRTIRSEDYFCANCAEGYEPTLDDRVEVTFTVSSRVRPVTAHDPERLSPLEYFRQITIGSHLVVPPDYESFFEEVTLEALELPSGERAIMSLQMNEGLYIVEDLVTHTAQFLEIKGEHTKERQHLPFIIDRTSVQHPRTVMRPGSLRITFDNRRDRRALPTVFIAGERLFHFIKTHRPFLSAKRLLSNQTFRDIYRTDTLGVDQRLKITSLTFVFTDLRGSTELYERVGDLAAFDLVKAHFNVLNDIVAVEGGAVVKTIGDAVMATFPTPDRALTAALRMRDAMRQFNQDRQREDLLLKIGMHEGPCIAVTLNERQDYFGQTVNIASRVQGLANAREIFATSSVISNPRASGVLESIRTQPVLHEAQLRGIADRVNVYAIP
jgi:class 3 adenylate cyclase